MSDNRGLYIEENIKNAVKRLLCGRVNELLEQGQAPIPPIEFGQSGEICGNSTITPLIALSTGERTEKERIIRLDAYALTITFTLPERDDGELLCYAYAAAFVEALKESPTLEGIVDRVDMTGKKYRAPKTAFCGEGWAVTLSLRVVVEGLSQ